MRRSLRFLALGATALLSAVPCAAVEPPTRPATATEAAAAASLKAAQVEHDRLMHWHKDAMTFLSADALRAGNLRALRTKLQLLAMSLTDADPAGWAAARSALVSGELDRMLTDGALALDNAGRNQLIEPADVRRLQDLQKQARQSTAAFDLAAPVRLAQSDWDGQRDKLFAAVRDHDNALSALDAAYAELQRRLQARALAADTQLAGLQRMILLLQPPVLPASAARRSP